MSRHLDTVLHREVAALSITRPEAAGALLADAARYVCERALSGAVRDEVLANLEAALRTSEDASTMARRRLSARAEEQFLTAGRAAALAVGAAAAAAVFAFHRARGEGAHLGEEWARRCADHAVGAVVVANDRRPAPAVADGVPLMSSDLLSTLDADRAAEAGRALLAALQPA